MIYTLLLQHTTSKLVYGYVLEDRSPDSIYYKFRIKLDDGMDDGEYEFLILSGNEDIDIDINNIFDSRYTMSAKKIIPDTFGLMVIGDNSTERVVYNKEQQYYTYGK